MSTATAAAAKRDPIDRIEWVHACTLKANAYNPNVVFDQELRLLETSLLMTGWVQPILVSRDSQIIDGFHRWRLSQDSPRVAGRWGGMVPIARLSVDAAEAMMLTIRMNRAKGTHVAVRMSDIVKKLIDVHGCDPQEIAQGIGATRDEVDLLYQDSIFKARGIDKYRYSKAWVPVETVR
jgi:ParB-like chromosome segregation protein Spo0J